MIRSSLTDPQVESPDATVGWRVPPARPNPITIATHPGAAGFGAIVAAAMCAVIAIGGWFEAPPTGAIVWAVVVRWLAGRGWAR